jgi:uncharacterized phage protein (TIGR02218 family)
MAHDRTISANLKAHFALETTTIALCYKILRADGTVYRFTTHDAEVPYGGEVFSPVGSGSISDLKLTNTLAVDNQDLDVLYTTITSAELRAGLFDDAEIWTFKINYMAPEDGILKLVYGKLGELEIKDNQAKIEIRSLTQQLTTPIGRILTPECDANLGDTRCKVSMGPFTHNVSVTSFTSTKKFIASGLASVGLDNYFKYGKVQFTSGFNNGVKMQVEVSTNSTGEITLLESLPFALVNGDTFTAYAGCDRRKSTCKTRFSNVVNFRGFDGLPGLDKIVVIPTNVEWVEY